MPVDRSPINTRSKSGERASIGLTLSNPVVPSTAGAAVTGLMNKPVPPQLTTDNKKGQSQSILSNPRPPLKLLLGREGADNTLTAETGDTNPSSKTAEVGTCGAPEPSTSEENPSTSVFASVGEACSDDRPSAEFMNNYDLDAYWMRGRSEHDSRSVHSGGTCESAASSTTESRARNDTLRRQRQLEDRISRFGKAQSRIEALKAKQKAAFDERQARREVHRKRLETEQEAERAKQEAEREEQRVKEEAEEARMKLEFEQLLAAEERKVEDELRRAYAQKEDLAVYEGELLEAYAREEQEALRKGKVPEFYRSSQDVKGEMFSESQFGRGVDSNSPEEFADRMSEITRKMNLQFDLKDEFLKDERVRGSRREEIRRSKSERDDSGHSGRGIRVHNEKAGDRFSRGPRSILRNSSSERISRSPPRTERKSEVPIREDGWESWELPYLNNSGGLGGTLPIAEPPVFSGCDKHEYLPFKTAFQEVVLALGKSHQQFYGYLLKYTSGEAREIVNSCYDPSSYKNSFRRAVTELEALYGDAWLLAQDYLDRLKNWPALKPDNMKSGLRSLYLFLIKINNVRRSRPEELAQLDHHAEIKLVIDKLPYSMAAAWRDIVQRARDSGRLARFSDLVEFIRSQSARESLPVFGDLRRRPARGATAPSSRVATTRAQNVLNKAGAAQTSASVNETVRQGKTAEKLPFGSPQHRCGFCNGTGHSTDICLQLGGKPETEVRAFLRDNQLCFRCTGPHFARRCKARVQCAECGSRFHCRSLHSWATSKRGLGVGSPKKTESRPARAFCGRLDARVFSPVVPALVRLGGRGAWQETNVALDCWASNSFMSKEMAARLNVSGDPTPINMATLAAESSVVSAIRVDHLEICRLGGSGPKYSLRPLHVIEAWPFDKFDIPNESFIQSFEHLRKLDWRCSRKPVGILLGNCEPELTRTFESIAGSYDEPIASRHALGWALNGPVSSGEILNSRCYRSRVFEIPHDLEAMYRAEFEDSDRGEFAPAPDEQLWLARVESSLKRNNDGKVVIDLPLRDPGMVMPDNEEASRLQLLGQKRRMLRDPEHHQKYIAFLDKMIKNGHMVPIPKDEVDPAVGCKWYLRHHGVYHKVKGKLRVVFDCSFKYHGVSLNDRLLPGPDLMNKLVGVLLRFRRGRVAVVGDIEQMFLQIRVPPHHADLMRVWWWPDGDLDKPPEKYRLTSHPFGAVSSPSVANWVVSQLAGRAAGGLSNKAGEVLASCAYMDDLLGSFCSPAEAVREWKEVRHALASVGFNLTDLSSPCVEVMSAFDKQLWGKAHDLDLGAPVEIRDRVLGLEWDLSGDSFSVKTGSIDKPLTKRGMLSVIGGVYDPLGLVVPAVVPARSLFQEVCRCGLGWDESLPSEIVGRWKVWLAGVKALGGFSVSRWLSLDSTEAQQGSLHIFCDGSETAFAAVAYIRVVRGDRISVTLVMAKARQVPVSGGVLKTIPRIELAAAVLAVDLYDKIERELAVVFDQVCFWSDSMIVLGYLRAVDRRFQRYVSNRIDKILNRTSRQSWRFVPGRLNIADLASRGCSAGSLLNNEEWREGPKFLSDREVPDFEEPVQVDLPESRGLVAVGRTVIEERPMDSVILSTSSWRRLLRRVIVLMAFWRFVGGQDILRIPFSLSAYKEAEYKVWYYVQRRECPAEVRAVECKVQCPSKKWAKLTPYLDDQGLVRARGRLAMARESEDKIHPLILPISSPAVQSRLRAIHDVIGHMGGRYLLATICESYCIFGVGRFIKDLTASCVHCRRILARREQPEMADLPECRVTPARKAFERVGMDFFGPFEVINGRTKKKVWGVVFTCLASRAIHLEVTQSLDTSSCICAFRRFLSRRGRCLELFSDNGTNLVGACREIHEQMASWNKARLSEEAREKGIVWKFNPPHASNFGGVWEGEIRIIRRVFVAIVRQYGMRLSMEEMRTVMCEVEAILNGRPLTPVVADALSMGPLTPNHLLLMDPPLGVQPEVEVGEVYLERRWRYVQYVSNQFWARWRKEYLTQLRARSKWLAPSRPLQVGDLVLVSEPNAPRGSWPLGLVTEAIPSHDGVVRKVKVKCTLSGDSDRGGSVEKLRPANKLVLVLKQELSKVPSGR